MKLLSTFLLLFLTVLAAIAQTDSAQSALHFSGYAEVYYSYDFARPEDHIRQPFFYSHNRHNTLALNLGFMKAAYDNNRVRANFALMAGTYANDNLSAEPGVLKSILEANMGVRLSKTKSLWLDAGIMPSHIGWESAVGKDDATLTRSLAAENSPYFETGARLSFATQNGKWYAAILALNGWQRIERPAGNNTPAWGHQLTWKPNGKIVLNSSSFIGSDKPDSLRQMRWFHDFYGQFSIATNLSVTAGVDAGAEQKNGAYNMWYTPVAIVSYRPANNWQLALRGEYYQDERGVLIPVSAPGGFRVWGYSVNIDRPVTDHALWRIEMRGLHSSEAVFRKGVSLVQDNVFITTALAVQF